MLRFGINFRRARADNIFQRPTCARDDVESIRQSKRKALGASPGDHAPLSVHSAAAARRARYRFIADDAAFLCLVGGDTAGRNERGWRAGLARKHFRPQGGVFDEVDDVLKTLRTKRRRLIRSGAIFRLQPYCCLQPDSEKFASLRPCIGRGRLKRSEEPRAASFSTCGPPG